MAYFEYEKKKKAVRSQTRKPLTDPLFESDKRGTSRYVSDRKTCMFATRSQPRKTLGTGSSVPETDKLKGKILHSFEWRIFPFGAACQTRTDDPHFTKV